MKKFLLTILALVYLISSVGANVYRHYCMDKLVAWGVGQEKQVLQTCPYCGMPQTDHTGHCNYQAKGCCHDEQRQVKIEKDQNLVNGSIKLAKPFYPIVSHAQASFSFALVQKPAAAYLFTCALLQTSKVSLFIRNCVFRI